MDYEKKFIIIGAMTAITYKEIFPYIKNNQLWLGASGFKDMAFKVPSYYEEKSTRFWIDESGQHWRSLGNGCWFTNVEHVKRHTPIDLYKRYSNEYPKYDNINAVEVKKVAEIPMDYDGIMGVPITFLDKYCPEQFEIVDALNRYTLFDYFDVNEDVRKRHSHCANIDGTAVFNRILIRKRTA